MTKHNLELLSDDLDTIVALCTPRGSGSIAMIRLSGKNAFAVADACARLSSGRTIQELESHTIHHGYIVDHKTNQKVDEVLFFLMRGPKTFTGQDVIEISCHNNPFVIEKIIECTLKQGARPAQAGEFSKRAFLNGKIDLLQAEALNELIHAQTERALQTSLAQLSGSLSHYLKNLEQDFVWLISLVESSFEFLEEEQRDLSINQLITTKLADIHAKIDALKKNFNQQKQIKEGIRISLIGSVNAGKSTLFNALLNQERAIVTDQAGTTRDSIEATLYKKGNFWLVIDTAGLRETNDIIEQQGIQRSRQEAHLADIILLVLDGSRETSPEEQAVYEELYEKYHDKMIIVINKVDAGSCIPFNLGAHEYNTPILQISAKLKTGIDALELLLEEKITVLFSKSQSPFLLNQRHLKTITEIEQRLHFIEKNNIGELEYEILAYQLKEILEKIAELTGRSVTEAILDSVFKTFCVGK